MVIMASVAGYGLLAEGSNIHFSPIDKKPLCSYSNKVCRQRRLNGYGFCIRHILEDKSSPFKQCHFVTRNNSQKCLNAIPSSQERGYCHSHMQVAGMVPKTVKKVKENKGTTQSQRQSSFSKTCKEPSIPGVPSSKLGTKDSPPLPFKSRAKKQDCPPNISTESHGQLSSNPKKKKSKSQSVQKESNLLIPKEEEGWNHFRDKSFEQLKTLKILEKLSLNGRGSLTEVYLPERSLPLPIKIEEKMESRQEYLQRVRYSYQSEYNSLCHALKIQSVKESRLDNGLRESLLACARIDPTRCAQILRSGEDSETSSGRTVKGLNGVTNSFIKVEHSGLATVSANEVKVMTKSGQVKVTEIDDNQVFTTTGIPQTKSKHKGMKKPKQVTKGTVRKWDGHLEGSQDSGSQPLPPPVKKRQKLGSSKACSKSIQPLLSAGMENHVANGPVHNNTGLSQCQSMNLETVLHSASVTSSDTPDGVITDTSFDSAFDHSPSHPDSDFGDVDELERSFVLHIDPEIAHQASRIMEENGLTEADFLTSDLFPESRLVDQKVGVGGLGTDIDLSSSLDPTDIDYALFNIFPHSHSFQRNDSVSLRNNL